MGRLSSTVKQHNQKLITAELAKGNTSLKGLAEATGLSKRSISRHLAMLDTAPTSHSPSAAPSTHTEDRLALGRARLWDILNDPNASAQVVVAAFNALSESEGWSQGSINELPEPRTDEEIIERFITLFTSFPPSLQAQILTALEKPASTT